MKYSFWLCLAFSSLLILLADAPCNAVAGQDTSALEQGRKIPSPEITGEKKNKHKIDEILIKYKSGVTESRKIELHKKHGSEKIKDFKALRLHHRKLRKGMSVEEAISHYKSDPDVEYAEPNFLVYPQNTPNDPQFAQQWALSTIDAQAAWDITTGNSDVVIAVLDTGIDYTHPDLINNLWINQAELNGQAGIDEDGNGYVDDIYGFNAIANNGDPKDEEFHGTQVAGVIGAVGNNATGVTGVAWNVKIMACKATSTTAPGSISDIIECLQYVKAMKARGVNIVATNNSWGFSYYSQALYDTIREQKDILFVTAAGNDNSKNPSYPSGFDLPNIISVAASDRADGKASFSNYGKWGVDIAAPGDYIFSTTLPFAQSYNYQSGTSLAAPFVSGLAALLKAQDMTRTTPTLKNLILAGGDQVSSFTDLTVTGRRINAYKSLTCVDSPLFAVLHLPTAPQPGVPQTLSAMSINCGSAVGPVSVTTSGGSIIQLHDDGVAPDEVAGDGIFTGIWNPSESVVETLTFTSPIGSTSVSSPLVAIGGQPSILSTSMFLPGSVTSATTGTLFSMKFPTSGGIPPFNWSLVDRFLPAGLTLNSQTGEIAGTPVASGVFPITLQVSDSLGVKDRKEWTLLFNDGLRPGWPRELQGKKDTPWQMSYSPVIADLDGDGKDEIIVADGHNLYVYFPDGTSKAIILPGCVTSPVVADLDGDGRKEIIVSVGGYYTSSNSIYAFHSDLTPVTGFPAGAYPTTNGGPGQVSSPVVADFNNDGQVKIAIITHPNNLKDPNYKKSVVIMVDSQGSMVPGWPQIFENDDSSLTIDAPPAVGDIDLDGKKELVFATKDGFARIFRSDGTLIAEWQFEQSPRIVWSPVLADVDGDGILDIVIKYNSAALQDVITVLNRNGTPLPGWPKKYANRSWTPNGPIATDIDGDGRPEIVFVSSDGGWSDVLQVLRGDGTSLPGWPIEMAVNYEGVLTPREGSYPSVADIDGDGKPEIVVAIENSSTNGKLLAYSSSGNLSPGFPKHIAPTKMTFVGSHTGIKSTVAIGDVDGNGKLDLVVKGEVGFLYVWEMNQVGGGKAHQWPMYRNNEQHFGMWVASHLKLTPDSHDFNNVLTEVGPVSRAFTIKNILNVEATISSISISGQDSSLFSLTPGTCGNVPFNLGALQSCTVNVSFSPTGVGKKKAVLTVSSASPNVLTVQALLSGTDIRRLDYAKSGSGSGTVTVSTGTSYSSSGSEIVTAGTVAVISAIPAADSAFTGWGGACAGTGSCSVTMDGDKSVTASFAKKPVLNFNRLGAGTGTVTILPSGTSFGSNASQYYNVGTVVTLTALADENSVFNGWAGACTGMGDCTLTMDSDKLVGARFRDRSPDLSKKIAIAAGESHTVALKGDGTVWAWGSNEYGKLGDGTTTNRITPVHISGLSGVTAIAARGHHTIALMSDGTVWTWGANYDGQLGNGSTTQRSEPWEVPGLSGVIAIASGTSYSVALKGDGTVWSWGDNYYGQLGDGTTTDKTTPVQAQGLSGVSAIGSGISHTVALKSDGTVWSWGLNGFGELGDGTTTDRHTPVKVSGLSEIVGVYPGQRYTEVLKMDGSIWGWGVNNFGQLGDGTTINRKLPVRVAELSGVLTIIGGGAHTIAALGDGTVSAWGYNDYGQLGDGSTTQKPIPTQLPGFSDVLTIAAGWGHSVAVKQDGTIWTWGYNSTGQLGDGTTTNRKSPVQVQGLNLDTTAPTVLVSPPGGTFTPPQTVTLTSNEPAIIYYTLDGSTPTAASSVYASPLNITYSKTLKYFAVDRAGNNSPVAIQAYTIMSPIYPLDIKFAGNSGGIVTVLSKPPAVDCTGSCSQSFENGTIVTLTPMPDSTTTFTGWSGACTGSGSCSLAMDGAKTVTATFTKKTLLSFCRMGTGKGSVTASPSGTSYDADFSQYYDAGTVITFSA
ncbi:MAG: S8 family serine peptidase, partial [Deltaproteobacteria bacterium]|nr:S8 family serine peptidase [Deltaproteobacteria bacterium]